MGRFCIATRWEIKSVGVGKACAYIDLDLAVYIPRLGLDISISHSLSSGLQFDLL